MFKGADIMGENRAYTNFSFNSMLPLDMLAEVASETLKSDPTLGFQRNFENQSSHNVINKNCAQKRSATNCEVLSLDQIRVLSDKMLLEMFSEHSSDEIRKNFSYKCYLMPEKCCEIFSSFGNETKARLQMKSHLLTHIAQLLAEANAPDVECPVHFVAEPLSARRKRLQEMSPKKRKKSKHFSKRTKNSLPKKSLEKKSVVHKTKSVREVDQRISHFNKFTKLSNQDISANVFEVNALTRLRKNVHANSVTKKLEKENSLNIFPSALGNVYLAMQKGCNSNLDVQEDINKINNCIVLHPDIKVKEKETTSEIWGSGDITIFGNNMNENTSDCNISTVGALEFPYEDNVIKKGCVESCHKTVSQEPITYPQHDHTYTSVNGKTYIMETSELGRSNGKPIKEGRRQQHKCSGVAMQLIIPTPAFPYVYEPLLPHISEIREIGNSNRRSCDKCAQSNFTTNCSIKKSSSNVQTSVSTGKHVRYRKVNRLIIPEEMEPDTEDDENVPLSFTANFIEDRLHEPQVTDDSVSEHQSSVSMLIDKNNSSDSPHLGERKLALKCIRALRMKKKDERGPLICQICNGKSFTAQATLMYHYRSHAGIKPFTCSVCDATFTRQHSLNYHMLIHNNKSRFICDECGRSFRHPSHYKEHLRRHTGETPYQCTDCSLRFKTRNTYKRHLKTRHGKILTARGIRILSVEEFDKVRTMPRRRAPKQSMLPSQVQESQWSDLTFSSIPAVKTEILEK